MGAALETQLLVAAVRGSRCYYHCRLGACAMASMTMLAANQWPFNTLAKDSTSELLVAKLSPMSHEPRQMTCQNKHYRKANATLHLWAKDLTQLVVMHYLTFRVSRTRT